MAGQYAGFGLILLASVVGALGASVLSDEAIAYLGLLPLLLGLRAAWRVWRERQQRSPERSDEAATDGQGEQHDPSVWHVASVTFANGGDNIGVYVPVFGVVGVSGMTVYIVVFLIGVAVWCVVAHLLTTRPIIAGALTRKGHVLLPGVLIAIGLFILIKGGAFGS